MSQRHVVPVPTRRAFLRAAGAVASFGALSVAGGGLLLAESGCASRARSGLPRVAVSIFPLYDLARRVAADKLDVVLVLPPGRSEHSFDPTPREMARIADTRLALSVGLGMDDWLERIVRNAAGSSVTSIALGPRLEPIPFTLEHAGEEEAEAAEGHGHGHEDEHGPIDPHVWLDPVRMQTAVGFMVDAFTRLVPAQRAAFRQRGDAVIASLRTLHEATAARARTWPRRQIVTFHGSMGYYAARYGLTVAAVVEPFPGREPTAPYIAAVLRTLAGIPAAPVFTEPQMDPHPAQVIAEQAHRPLFQLDPVGGTAGVDTYERLIHHNTDALARALS